MATTNQFTKEAALDLLGEESGLRRQGKFTFKTLLTRGDRFRADEARRRIIGANPTGTLVTLQEEAFVIGQLSVRILTAPAWWTQAANGEEIEDGNVIGKLYEMALAAENERRQGLVSSAEQAHAEISKNNEE